MNFDYINIFFIIVNCEVKNVNGEYNMFFQLFLRNNGFERD